MGEGRVKPLGVLLAGGLAMRMGGGDKGMVRLAGEPLLAHIARRLRPQVAALALNANGDPSRFAEFRLPVLADTVPGHPGPLAGVLAGMIWAKAQGAGQLLTAPTDAPFLPDDLVARLARAAAPVAIATSGDWTHPTVALWSVELAGALDSALRVGTRKVMDFQAAHGAVAVDWPMQPYDPFFNVNSPADVAAAEAILSHIEPSPSLGEGGER